MFKAISSVLTLACLSLAAQAQPFETAQVISATPVLTQTGLLTRYDHLTASDATAMSSP